MVNVLLQSLLLGSYRDSYHRYYYYIYLSTTRAIVYTCTNDEDGVDDVDDVTPNK